MDKKIIAIHQPNVLPWMGYFHKIKIVDEFIFFDNVRVSNGKSWFSRVKILLNGKEFWLTIPIIRNTDNMKICDIKVAEPKRTWRKTLGTIKQAYFKAEFFSEIFDFLNQFNLEQYNYLSEFNIDIIIEISKKLDLKNKVFKKTSDEPELLNSNQTQTDMILQVCKFYQADKYISGNGCLDFFNQDLLKLNGIDCDFQIFNHPIYKQLNNIEYFKGLSIIDALMNCGFERVKEQLNN